MRRQATTTAVDESEKAKNEVGIDEAETATTTNSGASTTMMIRFYQQTCERELGGSRGDAPDNSSNNNQQQDANDEDVNDADAPPNNILVSQSDFATFVWNFCAVVQPGSACTNSSVVDSSTTESPSSSSSSSSFDALPLPVQLLFAPPTNTASNSTTTNNKAEDDEDATTGCSTDASVLETLNCILISSSSSSSSASAIKEGDEIYLMTSQNIDILCSNDTYWLLLENNMLEPEKPNERTQDNLDLAPSSAPLAASFLRPSNGNVPDNDNDNNSLSPGAIAAIVLIALLIPLMVLLATRLYCWRRKHSNNNNDQGEQASKNLLQIFTKCTAFSFEDVSESEVPHPSRRSSMGGQRDNDDDEEAEDPALVEDQSVISSENSQSFSPVSMVNHGEPVVENSDGKTLASASSPSSPLSWIFSFSPRDSEARQRSFQQTKRSSNKKSRRHGSCRTKNGAPVASVVATTTRSSKSVQSHHSGNSSSRASRRSRDTSSLDKNKRRSTFMYPTELGHESVVSPGNSTWFQTTTTTSRSSSVTLSVQPEQISLDNPVHQRKRFNNNKSNPSEVPAGPTLTLMNGSAKTTVEVLPHSSSDNGSLRVGTNSTSSKCTTTNDLSNSGANNSQELTTKPISRYS